MTTNNNEVLPRPQATKVKQLIANGCDVLTVVLSKVENGVFSTAVVSRFGNVSWVENKE